MIKDFRPPVDILKIADSLIRGEKCLVFPLKIHNGWISDQLEHHILDVRGWGYLQYAGEEIGADLQDSIGEWVVQSLNEAYARAVENKA